MANKYILDACALVAFVRKEPGYEVVRDILVEAMAGKVVVYINIINLLEVHYGFRREDGILKAESLYDMVLRLPIIINESISREVFLESSRFKSSYRMSVADSIALAEASVMGASIITSDHHEFNAVEQIEDIKFTWIR